MPRITTVAARLPHLFQERRKGGFVEKHKARLLWSVYCGGAAVLAAVATGWVCVDTPVNAGSAPTKRMSSLPPFVVPATQAEISNLVDRATKQELLAMLTAMQSSFHNAGAESLPACDCCYCSPATCNSDGNAGQDATAGATLEVPAKGKSVILAARPAPTGAQSRPEDRDQDTRDSRWKAVH